LNQLDWHDFAQRVNLVAAAFLARMRGAQAEKPQVLRHALELLGSLHLPPAREYLLGRFVSAYTQLTPQEEKEFHKDVAQLPQARKELVMGKAMSFMDKGRLQGRLQGRREATQQIVCRLLRKRLGALDSASEARVSALSSRRLEQLSEALLDFTAVADLDAWLKAQTRR